MNFILGIRNFEAVGDFSYELKNCNQILERIEDYEFKQSEALNFNLLDYILLQKEKGNKYDNIMQQIVNHSTISKEFIKAYLDRDFNLKIFIHDLCHKSDWIWFDFITDNSLSEDKKYKYLELMLCSADIADIENNNGDFEDEDEGYEICKPICSFMQERKDILQRLTNVPLNKMTQVIETLGIRFKELDIEGVDEELLEDIIERLYRLDLKKCLQVINKEPVIWEKLESCCADGLQNEEGKPIVLKIWNYILEQNRTNPSWDNYSKYRDEFGVTGKLIEFLDTHVDDFIMASDASIVNDNIIKEIIIENISLQSFVKFIQKFQIEEFTNELSEFDKDKMEAMIAERYFPFSAERCAELREVYPNLCIEFICKNKDEFMESIDDCGLVQDEIVELLKNNSFSDDEKIKILNQIESTEIDEREVICQV